MKKILLSSFFVLLAFGLQAQTSDNPWYVGAGVNGISLQNDISRLNNPNVTTSKDGLQAFNFGVPSLSVFRAIVGGLSIGGNLSLNNIKEETGNGEIKYYNLDALLKYGFNRNGSVSPYIKGGWGLSSFDASGGDTEFSNLYNPSSSIGADTYIGGAGLSFRLGDRWSAFVESTYRFTQDDPMANFLQHSAGVAVGFGSGDADKDGISDKKDKCPDVPGLKEFEGCPDTDGDGIPDNEDDCPEEAGPAENKGCPDTDGDGVLDKDDACPEVAGLEELNGCPDADGDGVADPDDECVDVVGPVENNGCPWPDKDNDGVPDKDDACPDEAGENGNACPEVAKAVLEALNAAGVNILFPADGFKLMGKKVMAALDQVKTILEENPDGIVLVQGHASEDGSEEYNLALSQKRAEAVKAKLVELGIDESRLEVEAFGEQQPIGDNTTTEGRVKSRRVEFKAKE